MNCSSLLYVLLGSTLFAACSGQQVYLSLGSTTITTNNTEFLITDIGGYDISSLTCHTDLPGCCNSKYNTNGTGSLGGEWYYPNGSMVPGGNMAPEGALFIRRRNALQVARLIRDETLNPLTPTGSYCCVIPTTGGEMTFCANLVVCPSLTLTNGMISYFDPTLGVGSIAIHSCTPGRVLNPQDMNTRICRSNGMWTGSAPTCEGSDTGAVAGGVVALIAVLIIAFSVVLIVYILKNKRQRGSVDLRNTVVQQELAVPSVKETSHNEPHTYSTVDATYEEIDPHVSFKVKTDYDYTHNEAYVTTVREGLARESPLVETGAPMEATKDLLEQ